MRWKRLGAGSARNLSLLARLRFFGPRSGPRNDINTSDESTWAFRNKAMSLIALIALLAQNFGLGRTYPWALLPYGIGRWIWLAPTLGLLALLAEQAGLVRFGGRWRKIAAGCERALGHRAALIVLLAGNALFQIVNWNHFGRYGYTFPWTHLALLAAAAVYVRRDRFWLSCALSLALLIASIVHFPLDVERSAMLAGVQSAWTDLALGRNPYAMARPLDNGFMVVMPYLPGTFFSHAPAWILGLDLRWNQFCWRALWMPAVAMALARLPAQSPWRTVAHVFVLNPYFNFRHELYYEVFFVLIVAYHAWPRWRWLGLPALVWTRQWAWVLAPFLALDWLGVRNQRPEPGKGRPGAQGRLDWRGAGRQAAWLAAGMALVSGAFILALWPITTWAAFTARTLGFVGRSSPFEYGLTLGPVAARLGLTWLLHPAQAAALGALGAVTLWRWWHDRDSPPAQASESIERMGLVSLCVVILLNPFYEVSFWTDASFWILAAYALRAGERQTARGAALHPAKGRGPLEPI